MKEVKTPEGLTLVGTDTAVLVYLTHGKPGKPIGVLVETPDGWVAYDLTGPVGPGYSDLLFAAKRCYSGL